MAALAGLAAACVREPTKADPSPQDLGYQASDTQRKLAAPPAALAVEWPEPNAQRGRIMFVTRACVICHEVNGVGGKAAPSLDAPSSATAVKPLEFSSRMWRGAKAMTALQSVELGYVIDLDGEDLADLAAFAASREEQLLLKLDSVPAPLRDWFINDRYWENEDWSDYVKRGERFPSFGVEETP